MGDGNVRRSDDVHDRLDALRCSADVQMQLADLSGDECRHADVGNQTDQLLAGGVAGSVVRNGKLAADDLGDVKNIVCHGTGDGSWRICIGICQAVGRDALRVERFGLCQQQLGALGVAVGAKQTDKRRHAGGNRLGKLEFRRPGVEAALTAAADDMNMLVNEARNEHFARRVDHSQIVAPRLDAVRDLKDLVKGDQNILFSECLRRKYACIFDQNHKKRLLCSFIKPHVQALCGQSGDRSAECRASARSVRGAPARR